MGTTRTARRRYVGSAAALTAVVAVLAAGCGTADQRSNAVRPPTSFGARVPVPPGGSPAEARAVGRRMLASLILPSGSRRIAPRSQPPRPVIIGGQNVVDVGRSYWLPVPENSADRFLQQHVPAGTIVSGTGLMADSYHEVDYSLKAPPAGLEQDNMLVAALIAGPDGGTLLRVDAELTWYPSRSAAEYLPPLGYRSVSIADTSPTLTSHQAKARTITVVSTSPAVIARLARLLDGMHASAPWMGSCPANLPQFRIVFTPSRDASRAHATTVTPSGCRGESITAGGAVQPDLEDVDSTRLLAAIRPLLSEHHRFP